MISAGIFPSVSQTYWTIVSVGETINPEVAPVNPCQWLTLDQQEGV